MVLDQTLVKLTRLLDVPRRCLNISATCKGIVAGSLTYLDESGRRVDCRTPTGKSLSLFFSVANTRVIFMKGYLMEYPVSKKSSEASKLMENPT